MPDGIFVPGENGKMYRMAIDLDDLDFDTNRYVRVKEADGADIGKRYYYIDAVEDAGGDLVMDISYGEIIRPSGGYPNEYIGKTFYTYDTNKLPYQYDAANGTHIFKADYTQPVYDTVSYDGGFDNKEWFKKYVFDLEESQLADMSIDVVPVTMDELTPELLDKADLIYFADDNDAKGFEVQDTPGDKWSVSFTFDDAGGFSDSNAKAVTAGGDPSVEEVDGRKAVYLDGDDFLKVTKNDDSSLLTGVSEMTVSFDIKTENAANTDWAFFAEASGNSCATYGYKRYIGFFERSGLVELQRYDYPNNTSKGEVKTKNAMSTNVWTHVTAVFKESSSTLYINGVEIGTTEGQPTLQTILGDNGILQIGRGNWWAGGEYAKCYIDNFTIANYDLVSEKTIYDSVLEKAAEGVPVVLNRSLYEKTDNSLMMRKMAAVLMQPDAKEKAGIVLEAQGLSTLTANMKQPLEGTGVQTFVNGNIFVYDDVVLYDGVNRRQVVSGDFHSEIFSESEVDYGFTELLDEIENENFYLEVAGKTERIDKKVTMATAIRHIINFGDRRNVTKTSLRVLDLEPYDFEDYYLETYNNMPLVYSDIRYPSIGNHITVDKIETDSICLADGRLDKTRWIIENLAPQFADNPNDLSVTIMGTREYIGKIEDINENYDLIYLGMDTSIMNTKIETIDGKRVKTDETVYDHLYEDNFPVDGMVYVHVGDRVNIRSGIISNTDNRYVNGMFRRAGNDITSDKLRELTEYIEAGYAVIISDEMLIRDGDSYKINTDKIDSASNMYKLLNDVILSTKDGAYRYFGKNVNVKSAFETGNAGAVANREKFSRYMGISKLTLEYSQADLPLAYDESDGIADYLPKDADGNYRLKFRIKLKNDAAVDLANTSYNCKLYVDIDADGRYSEDEVLTGLQITDDGGSEKMADGNGRYHLSAGSTYQISRAIPEGYTGFIAWKLVFEQNNQEFDNVSERALVRSAVEGYSAVPHQGEKPLIKILQITSGSGNTNLDLKNDSYMKSLYQDAKLDFRIEVTKIAAGKYIDKSALPGKTHEEYLKEFDMLVMGFWDSYQIGNKMNGEHDEELAKSGFLAIREYALSGRSILFTHDLSGFNITDDSEHSWSWYANRYLRDIQGMDRFGVMSTYNTIPSDEKYQYKSLYDKTDYIDKIYKNDGTLVSTMPMAMNTILLVNGAYMKGLTYGETSRAASSSFNWGIEYNINGSTQGLGEVAVAQVNKGQITEYPYKISENFNVSGTHSQYMQLNMDTDCRDEWTNDDVVVWYTLDKRSDLGDSVYAAVEKDVRNSYFIFNKGNITYTGSGHRKVESQEEKRLFLNTLVAAYRAGMHAPRVLYKENEWETSATINSQYLPYDPGINDGDGGFLDEALPVHFYTTNVNLQKTNELLYAKYYIDGTESDYTIYVDGKYYKEVMPTKVMCLVEENGQLAKDDLDDKLRPINNSMHTATFSYADIGLGNNASIKDKYSTNIYIRLGYEELAAPNANGEVALPASESISKLNIVCTQLFELR